MLSLRGRLLVVLSVVTGLVGAGFLFPSAALGAAAQQSGRQPERVPVERGVKGDPGPLASEPRDFAGEFPTPEHRDDKPDGVDAAGSSQSTDARELKRVREVVGERTEATETYLLEDGSFVTDVSVVPKWYRDRDGEWAKVDNRVVSDPDRKGGFRNEGAGWSVRFGSIGDGVSYEIEGEEFSMRLTGGDAAVMPERDPKDDTVLWYRDVWPGVDVSYRVSAAAVKEDFHVESLDALNDST